MTLRSIKKRVSSPFRGQKPARGSRTVIHPVTNLFRAKASFQMKFLDAFINTRIEDENADEKICIILDFHIFVRTFSLVGKIFKRKNFFFHG